MAESKIVTYESTTNTDTEGIFAILLDDTPSKHDNNNLDDILHDI